jgi:hypothetical protein
MPRQLRIEYPGAIYHDEDVIVYRVLDLRQDPRKIRAALKL